MSIAIDEANDEAYKMLAYFYYSDSPLSFPETRDFGEDLYIAGRIAKPTEAEVEASAFAIYRVIANTGLPTPDNGLLQLWHATPENQRDMYRDQARAALMAARKAVTA